MGYKNDLIYLKVYMLGSWCTDNLWPRLLTWLTAYDEIRVLAFDIQLICSEYGLKHNLGQIKRFVFTLCLLSICIEHGL